MDYKFFRDQYKNPDNYINALSKEEKDDIAEYNKLKGDQKNLDSKIESPTEKIIKEVLNLLQNVSLKPEFLNDEKELNIINTRKKFIINQLFRVLEGVKNYIGTVSEFNRLGQMMASDPGKYRQLIENSDFERRSRHNKLISDLKIFIRNTKVNFDKNFSETERLAAEKLFTDRSGLSDLEIKTAISKRKLIEFSQPNIIISSIPKDPGQERKFIMDWAFAVYSDLSKLDKELQEFLNKTK